MEFDIETGPTGIMLTTTSKCGGEPIQLPMTFEEAKDLVGALARAISSNGTLVTVTTRKMTGKRISCRAA